jgi:hypothetical protein
MRHVRSVSPSAREAPAAAGRGAQVRGCERVKGPRRGALGGGARWAAGRAGQRGALGGGALGAAGTAAPDSPTNTRFLPEGHAPFCAPPATHPPGCTPAIGKRAPRRRGRPATPPAPPAPCPLPPAPCPEPRRPLPPTRQAVHPPAVVNVLRAADVEEEPKFGVALALCHDGLGFGGGGVERAGLWGWAGAEGWLKAGIAAGAAALCRGWSSEQRRHTGRRRGARRARRAAAGGGRRAAGGGRRAAGGGRRVAAGGGREVRTCSNSQPSRSTYSAMVSMMKRTRASWRMGVGWWWGLMDGVGCHGEGQVERAPCYWDHPDGKPCVFLGAPQLAGLPRGPPLRGTLHSPLTCGASTSMSLPTPSTSLGRGAPMGKWPTEGMAPGGGVGGCGGLRRGQGDGAQGGLGGCPLWLHARPILKEGRGAGCSPGTGMRPEGRSLAAGMIAVSGPVAAPWVVVKTGVRTGQAVSAA